MDIRLKQVPNSEPELVEVRFHQMNNQVQEIVSFVRSLQGSIAGTYEGERFEVPVSDVFYVEAVDNRVFLYTERNVYEVHFRLYELEHALAARHFLRVSKSTLVNLMKVESIKPALNGRFMVRLRNGEDVIVSRKYVPNLKEALKGGEAL